MKPHSQISILPLAILAGCWMSDMHDGFDVPSTLEIPPSSQEPRVPKLSDEDPAPDVVEVTLVAAPIEKEWLPGAPTSAWGYNGTSPGPLIEAKVGDRVIIHFRNELDEPTSIHWHGLRVPARMDGGAEGPVIAPGEGFEFEFVVPDAGLFWYHPHEDSSRQVERGLHGPFIVRGDAEPEVDVEVAAPGSAALAADEERHGSGIGRGRGITLARAAVVGAGVGGRAGALGSRFVARAVVPTRQRERHARAQAKPHPLRAPISLPAPRGRRRHGRGPFVRARWRPHSPENGVVAPENDSTGASIA
jgi:hypothetical protein